MIEPRLLPLAEKIERALVQEYERTPTLTDVLCIFGLENARIAIRQHFGFGRNERLSVGPETRGIVDACVTIATEHVDDDAGLSMKEFLILLEKIKRSVERHAAEGSRGYYEFVRAYLP